MTDCTQVNDQHTLLGVRWTNHDLLPSVQGEVDTVSERGYVQSQQIPHDVEMDNEQVLNGHHHAVSPVFEVKADCDRNFEGSPRSMLRRSATGGTSSPPCGTIITEPTLSRPRRPYRGGDVVRIYSRCGVVWLPDRQESYLGRSG